MGRLSSGFVLILRLYETDGTAGLAVSGLGLKLGEGCADGVELCASTLIYVVLVMQNVLNVEFQTLLSMATPFSVNA